MQNKWMAIEKHTKLWVALLHGAIYTAPFVLITQDTQALAVIGLTHALIDYWAVGDRTLWLKDLLGPKKYRSSWRQSLRNRKDPSNWLYYILRVAADNTLHLLINYFAIQQLG